jgi:hypothetical protein
MAARLAGGGVGAGKGVSGGLRAGAAAGRVATFPAAAQESSALTRAGVLEQRDKEIEEWLKTALTPEMKELIRQENEETERWEREAGEAP